MPKNIIYYSLSFTQQQKFAFETFYELGSLLIDLAHKAHVIESEEMEKWYYSSLDIQFITYDLHMSNPDSNEKVIFGLNKAQFASLKTMIALSEKVANWYKNLPDNCRGSFTIEKFKKFTAAFDKIIPSIQAIDE